MSHFIAAFIDERAARSYTHTRYALAELLALREAEDSAATREWLAAEVTDSLEDRNRVEDLHEVFLDRTREKLGNLRRGARRSVGQPRVLEARHANFSRWVIVDPVGASLFVADMLDRAHEAAIAEAPTGSSVGQPFESPANQALRKAADAAKRLAGELADATGEPFERAQAEIEQWRTTEPSLAPVEPLGLSETAVESLFPERAHTRRWLENLPVAQIAALAEGLRAVSGGGFVGRRLDQITARRAWPFLQELNGHLVTGAAETLKADPRPEFPVPSLERLKTRHGLPGFPTTLYFNAIEVSPAAYVDLIEREHRRITNEVPASGGRRMGFDNPRSSSFLLPSSHTGQRAGGGSAAKPPWPPLVRPGPPQWGHGPPPLSPPRGGPRG